MSQTTTKEFGKWRSMLWPVHTFELKKLIPMLLLMFFINFNYTILRDTKDALIITAPGSGAEALPFLISSHGNSTPAVITPAAVDTMRYRLS